MNNNKYCAPALRAMFEYFSVYRQLSPYSYCTVAVARVVTVQYLVASSYVITWYDSYILYQYVRAFIKGSFLE